MSPFISILHLLVTLHSVLGKTTKLISSDKPSVTCLMFSCQRPLTTCHLMAVIMSNVVIFLPGV